MLRNYLKIGFRNLLHHKLFTWINIGGMAIGMASFLVIALFIYDEWTFDKQVSDYERKYRVYVEHFNDDGRQSLSAMIAPMIAPTLAAEYPEVESYFRFMNLNDPILFQVGERKFIEEKGGYGDPSVIDMFSLELVEGDIAHALKDPGTIAISETLKNKYFPDKPAIGETILLNGPVKVSAVFRDFSSHSHLQIDYFLRMEDLVSMIPERMKSWRWSQFHTYVKLRPQADASALESKLKDFAERNAWPSTKSNGGYYIPHLMPLEKIHLHASAHSWDIAVRGNIQTVYILLATALFILVISILNFVNLSTARAINRAKEVGVRKVMGAYRTQLIYQFISEATILSLCALLIGMLMVVLSLPALNTFTEKNISALVLVDPKVLGFTLLFALIIGAAAGAYPAFYISHYKPTEILSRRSGSSGGALIRKGLVVLQFVLSFFLIVAAITVSDQHAFMRNANMGFDKDNVVVIRLRGDMAKNIASTKQVFSNHANVLNVSFGYGLPGEAYAGDGILDKEHDNKEWNINMLTVDHDYAKTLGLELIAGRDFSTVFPSDQDHAFILSEAAAKMLGHTDPATAIGHELAWHRWDAPDSLKEGVVIGIVKDIQLNSMRETIAPVVMQVYPGAYYSMALRIKPQDLQATINHFQKSWKQFNSDWPFEYKFLDENFDKMYKSEEKLATLFGYFTGFTIVVACLGLFGLVVYSTTQRYKEISIRKVLGAGEAGLVLQLARTYLLLISLAFLVAIPISYYAAWEWLQKFAFHVPIRAMLFVKAAGLILLITLITVGIQSLHAVRANPVDALKE
ncbi:MAG TPA: FtsX-like permease family protein [Chryseolinea sp.]|nr:FtsX-like permease family protein [Chryseolinea sp.]